MAAWKDADPAGELFLLPETWMLQMHRAGTIAFLVKDRRLCMHSPPEHRPGFFRIWETLGKTSGRNSQGDVAQMLH